MESKWNLLQESPYLTMPHHATHIACWQDFSDLYVYHNYYSPYDIIHLFLITPTTRPTQLCKDFVQYLVVRNNKGLPQYLTWGLSILNNFTSLSSSIDKLPWPRGSNRFQALASSALSLALSFFTCFLANSLGVKINKKPINS